MPGLTRIFNAIKPKSRRVLRHNYGEDIQQQTETSCSTEKFVNNGAVTTTIKVSSSFSIQPLILGLQGLNELQSTAQIINELHIV